MTQNSVGEIQVSVISMLGQNVLECHSGLRPPKKELPEWRSVIKITLVLLRQFYITHITQFL